MKWVRDLNEMTHQPNANMRCWLTKPYVLTKALKQVCQAFTLKRLSQSFILPPPDDREKLLLEDSEKHFVREVELYGDGVRLTYGRVTIPSKTYDQYAELFGSLGEEPIGEKILYRLEGVEREAFEYAYLEDKSCWGRRSIFTINGYPLLVTEGFFSTLPEFSSHGMEK